MKRNYIANVRSEKTIVKKHFKKCQTVLITIASGVLVGDVITQNLIANVISENNRLNFLTKNALSMFR